MTIAPPSITVRDDPSRLKAVAAKQAYETAIQAVRFRSDLDSIEQGRQLAKLWTGLAKTLGGHYRDFVARVEARHEYLGQQIPMGPGIPSDVSPADRAVLMTAWNNALARVRAARPQPGAHFAPDQVTDAMSGGRAAILQEAERFGDDITRRAVLTTYADDSRVDLIEAWAAKQSPIARDQFREWMDLGRLIKGGNVIDGEWIGQGFGQPKPPPEAVKLPYAVQTHNATVDAYNATGPVRGGQAGRRQRIELSQDEIVR